MPKSRLASEIKVYTGVNSFVSVKNIGELILIMLTYNINALIVPSVIVRLR